MTGNSAAAFVGMCAVWGVVVCVVFWLLLRAFKEDG